MQMFNAQTGHVCCEALIQPEIRPPAHRNCNETKIDSFSRTSEGQHQHALIWWRTTSIPKLPNHWCANSCAITLATRDWLLDDDTFGANSKAVSRYVIRPILTMKWQRLKWIWFSRGSACNFTPIFHGASREIRNSNHVHFWQWIRCIECLFKVLQHLRSDQFGIFDLIDGITSGPNFENCTISHVGFSALKIVDCVCDEIRWHRHCHIESIEHPARHMVTVNSNLRSMFRLCGWTSYNTNTKLHFFGRF